MGTREHWETVYKTKSITEVSWRQREARVSVDLITRVAPDLESAIVDVGGGASTLVDGLLSRGYKNVTVHEEHVAPSGAWQWFQYCLCEFRPARSIAA